MTYKVIDDVLKRKVYGAEFDSNKMRISMPAGVVRFNISSDVKLDADGSIKSATIADVALEAKVNIYVKGGLDIVEQAYSTGGGVIRYGHVAAFFPEGIDRIDVMNPEDNDDD